MQSEPFNTGMKYFSEFIEMIRLTIKLVKDDRIDMIIKSIPILCLVYLILPIDLLIGPVDDLLVIYFGMKFFISLCPSEIVEEHQAAMGKGDSGKNRKTTINGDFKEK